MEQELLQRIVSHLDTSCSSTDRLAAARQVVQWTEERGDAAARERLAATVPGLVTLLKELETPSADTPCTAEAQEVTARALFQLARSRRLRDVIREAGGLRPLSALLTLGPDSAAAETATAALLNLTAGCAANREALCLRVRGLNCLLRLLARCRWEPTVLGEEAERRRRVLEHACVLLDRLLVKTDAWAGLCKDAVRKEGGLAVIVALLRAALGATPPTPGAVVPRSVEALLSVLASLVAAHVHNRDALFQADTLPLLVKLLNAAPPAGDAAAATLASVASNSDTARAAVVAAGALPGLVRLLQEPTEATQRAAVTALMVLTYNHPAHRDLVATAGAVPRLVQLLTTVTPSTALCEKLAWALSNLAQGSAPTQAALVRLGAVAALVGALDGDAAAQKASAAALGHLLVGDSRVEALQAVVAADGLLPLLQLAAAAHGPARNHAVRALRHVGAMDARYAAALHTLLGQARAALGTTGGADDEGVGVRRTDSLGGGGLLGALAGMQATLARRLSNALERRSQPDGGLPLHAPTHYRPQAPPSSTAVAVMESVAVPPASQLAPPPQGLHGAAMCPAAAAFAPHAAHHRLKILVNSGGHVQRGGGEDTWCYVGGETRLVALRAGCSFRQMVSQLGVFAPGGTHVVRYALPGEEVLVAVRTDEDVRLMFEEWDLWARSVSFFSSRSRLQLYVGGVEKKENVGGVAAAAPAPPQQSELWLSAVTGSASVSEHFFSFADSALALSRSGAESADWGAPPGGGAVVPPHVVVHPRDAHHQALAASWTAAATPPVATAAALEASSDWECASSTDSVDSAGSEGRRRRARAAAAEAEAEVAATAVRQTMALQLIHPSELEGLQRLGAGAYGEVHRARWRGVEVAIKTIWPKLFVEVGGDNTRALSAEHVASFCREAQLISSLQHPHVVSVLGVVQGQRSPAVVTEYMERSLRHVLDRQPRALNARKRLGLALDAARGMAYLHSRRIVHCDLKSSNLLVAVTGTEGHLTLKVCDFGLAKHKRATYTSGACAVRPLLPWTAPEVLRNPDALTEKVDVYSFGIVLWELWTSLVPHHDAESQALMSGVLFHQLRPPLPDVEVVAPPHVGWAALVQRCWAEEPTARPSFTHLVAELEHMCAQLDA